MTVLCTGPTENDVHGGHGDPNPQGGHESNDEEYFVQPC